MAEIKESDWKILQELHLLALERYCEEILFEVQRITSGGGKSFHQKYLDIWAVLHRRDKELAETFDDLKRSRAFVIIAAMARLAVLSDHEIMRFSQETRTMIGALLGNSVGRSPGSQ
jgi:hypothetical protein